MVRGTGPGAMGHACQTLAGLEGLGMANFYGPQRFGKEGSTAEVGFDFLLGRHTVASKRANRDRFRKKLSISAAQAWLFNQQLLRRVDRGELRRVCLGDVMARRDSGGLFDVVDVEQEQARFDMGETVHTGPVYGHKVRCASGPAGAHEKAVLEEAGLTGDSFRRVGKLGRGTRRANLVFPRGSSVAEHAEGIVLQFTLPKGSYATTLLREVIG